METILQLIYTNVVKVRTYYQDGIHVVSLLNKKSYYMQMRPTDDASQDIFKEIEESLFMAQVHGVMGEDADMLIELQKILNKIKEYIRKTHVIKNRMANRMKSHENLGTLSYLPYDILLKIRKKIK